MYSHTPWRISLFSFTYGFGGIYGVLVALERVATVSDVRLPALSARACICELCFVKQMFATDNNSRILKIARRHSIGTTRLIYTSTLLANSRNVPLAGLL